MSDTLYEDFSDSYKLETVNECQSYYDLVDDYITEKDKEFFNKLPYPMKKKIPKITEDGSRVFYIDTIETCCEDNKKDYIESLKNFCEKIDAFVYTREFCDCIAQYDDFHEFISIYIGYREDNDTLKRFQRHQTVMYDNLKDVDMTYSVELIDEYKDITEKDRKFLQSIPYILIDNEAYITSDCLRVFKIGYSAKMIQHIILDEWERTYKKLSPNNDFFFRISYSFKNEEHCIFVGYWADNTFDRFLKIKNYLRNL